MLFSALLALSLVSDSSGMPKVATVYLLPKELMTRTRLSGDDVTRQATLHLVIKDVASVEALSKKLQMHACHQDISRGIDVRAVVEIVQNGMRKRYVADRGRIYGGEATLSSTCSSDWLWLGDTYFSSVK